MSDYLRTFILVMLLGIGAAFSGCGINNNANTFETQNMKSKSLQVEQQSVQKKKQNEKKHSKKVLLDVPIIFQLPELQNGCEVTSLAMLLQYEGIQIDKMVLADQLKKDTTPRLHDENGNITQWGNPEEGFVGDITGKKDGFGVYPPPILELLEKYLPERAVDLTKLPFETLLQSLDEGHPIIVWVTHDFKPSKVYKEWRKNGEEIKVTFDEHAVLLVGYDKKYCYLNDPLSGKKNQKIKRNAFVKVWNSMGNRAVSIKNP